MEGSVRKAGNRIRVTAQLINANTEAHLWSSKYDRNMEDIFALQTDIAENVAGALEIHLLPSAWEAIGQQRTVSLEAYTLYMKGRQFWNKRSETDVRKALEYFELAIDSDPDFALAHAGIADCWSVLQSWGYVSSAEAAPKMKKAVLASLKLDSGLAEAHSAYALELALYEWKWEEAELGFKRAIQLNPSYASAHQWYAYSVLRFTRRLDEELKESQKALELDPLAPVMFLNMGQTMYYREEYDKAIEYFEEALAIDSNFLAAHLWQADCYLDSARYDKGIELIEIYSPRVTSPTEAKFWLARAYGTAGRANEARRLVEEVDQAGDKEFTQLDLAWKHFSLGETDKMFECLERATLQRGNGILMSLINPKLSRTYGSDPRYQAIKSKVGI